MAKTQRKGRYHPSRVSGHQKMLRQKDQEEIFGQKKNNSIDKKLDLKKQDWSLAFRIVF